MARRSRLWEEGLAEDLKDPEFAREFIQAGLEEEMSLQLVLGKVIKCLGVKEFSKKVKMPSPNILRAVNPKQNITQDTLNRLLKPFGLRLSVAPLTDSHKKKRAA